MAPVNNSNKPKTGLPEKKVTSPLEEMVYMDELNRRYAKYVGIFQDYQVNPYTKKTCKLQV